MQTSIAYLMAMSPSTKRGTTVGIRQMAVRLGFTIGPLIGDFLWDMFDPAMSFWVAIVFFSIAFALALLLEDHSLSTCKILY